MDIIKLLGSWNINIPNNMGYLEYLCDNQSKNIYYIDKFPIKVSSENAYKFDQMDIFYQEVILCKALKRNFIKIETKYTNVMNKLWLYNKIFVQFMLPDKYFRKPETVINKEYKKFLPLLKDNSKYGKMVEIEQKKILEFWTQLSTRDVIGTVFYLEDYKAIIVPSWSYFIMYLHDIKYYQIIKDIVISEGLFLRHQL